MTHPRQRMQEDLRLRNFSPRTIHSYVLHENEQIFASRYKLVLPSEEELRAELERERSQLAGLSEDTHGGLS